MTQDAKNILIGIGITFTILFVLGMFFFGSIFMYQMGKNNTASEVVTAVEKVGVVVNETKTAVVEVKNSVDQLKVATEKNTTGINELKDSVEEISTQKPEVKVYLKVPTPKQDPPQDQSVAIETAVSKGLAGTKEAVENLGKRMDKLEDGQGRIEKRVGDLETRIGYIETDVNKINDASDRMRRMLMGEKEYLKFKEKELQQKDCNDLSGNK